MKRVAIIGAGMVAVVLIGCAAPPPVRPTLPFRASATPRPARPTAQHTASPPGSADTLTASSPTVESTLTPTAIPTVSSNDDWIPDIKVFNGVEMVLVPPGCFEMGSDTEEADTDEQPVNRQCFDVAYWIDRYEVTNAQYGSSGLFQGDDRPRDSVPLPDAAAHCESRGARLPTEAEWEYAARGPSSQAYPWGNRFDADVAVFAGSSSQQTAPVGSRPEGASWVGAFDMAGNLWEWTSTIYAPNAYPYPYTPYDGREDMTNLDQPRAIRGGSWSNEAHWMRASARKGKHPTLEWYGYVGFRCMRDYAGAD